MTMATATGLLCSCACCAAEIAALMQRSAGRSAESRAEPQRVRGSFARRLCSAAPLQWCSNAHPPPHHRLCLPCAPLPHRTVPSQIHPSHRLLAHGGSQPRGSSSSSSTAATAQVNARAPSAAFVQPSPSSFHLMRCYRIARIAHAAINKRNECTTDALRIAAAQQQPAARQAFRAIRKAQFYSIHNQQRYRDQSTAIPSADQRVPQLRGGRIRVRSQSFRSVGIRSISRSVSQSVSQWVDSVGRLL
jgi:hypothetical protein